MGNIILNKELLNVVPFQVDGNNILVKDIDDEVLVVLPNQPTAILVRSTEVIEFKYFNEDLEVVFTNYATEGDANLDFYTLQNILALSGGSSATSANQLLIISELEDINTNTISRGAVTTVLVPVTTTSTIALAANANRKSLLIWNNSGGAIRIGIGTTALSNSGLRIPANNGFVFDFVTTDAIHIRTESGVNNVNLIWS